MEIINATFISDGVDQSERLIKLNNNARMQMESLKNNKNIKELEMLQKQVNNDNKCIIENK